MAAIGANVIAIIVATLSVESIFNMVGSLF